MDQLSVAIEYLRRDLAAFADPGTVTVSVAQGRLVDAVWQQSGRDRSAKFSIDTDSSSIPESVAFEGEEVSYANFMSSSRMADLRGLAGVMRNVIRENLTYVPISARSVVAAEDESIGSTRDSGSIILDLAETHSDRTNVVFVSAEAGVGKTTLLRELVRQQAMRYLNGETSQLWLYVNAQGSRLARLDQAIAGAIDDVRGRFPYHAAVPLVRSGALTLVIDGFDELIGSAGSYDEAFGSLATFIGDLGGSGCIIAAARSAYYEQEFLSRANEMLAAGEDNWVLHPVRLVEWSDLERATYIRAEAIDRNLKLASYETFADAVTLALDGSDVADIGHKPFFVSKVVDILASGEELSVSGSFLDRLVSAYLDREVFTKLRSPSTDSPMISPAQYREILSEVAEEMWRQESRQLNRNSLRELGELMGEMLGLGGDDLSEIVERLPYTAFLAAGSLPGSIEFTHDIFYAYFLADPISKVWETGDARLLRGILRRGQLPREAAATAGTIVRSSSVQELLDRLFAVTGGTGPDGEQIRRNAGNLTAGILSRRSHTGLAIRSMKFADSDLTDCNLTDSELRDCTFTATDLSTLVLQSCRASGLVFEQVLVDPDLTRLDIDGVGTDDFVGLGVREAERDKLLFSPIDVQRVLAQVGLPGATAPPIVRNIPDDVLRLTERLCHLFTKTNAITEEDDNAMVNIISHHRWRLVRSAMLESGVLTSETKPASGRKIFLVRHSRPQDIMAGIDREAVVPEMVREMWDSIEESLSSAPRI